MAEARLEIYPHLDSGPRQPRENKELRVLKPGVETKGVGSLIETQGALPRVPNRLVFSRAAQRERPTGAPDITSFS